MTIPEIRELLSVLEQLNPDVNLRLTSPYEKKLHEAVRKSYLSAVEHTAWQDQELVISDKK